MKTDRLEMFSDGVFAIAITLLILEVKIPKHEDLIASGGLYNYLLHLWPSYLSYVVSFFVLGIYWSNHHHLFTFVIKKTDHVFNMMNILFLMTIAFMPFTTAVMGDFILDGEYRNAAVTTYCIGICLPPPTILVIILYATYKKRLVDPKLSKRFINKQIIKLIFALVGQGTALAFSFNYPIVSIWIIVVCLFIYFLPPDQPEYDEV